MPKMIEDHDHFCPWPFFQAYGVVMVPAPKKPRKKRAPKLRSPIAKDLRSPKYKPRVIPNKKRKAKAPAIPSNPAE